MTDFAPAHTYWLPIRLHLQATFRDSECRGNHRHTVAICEVLPIHPARQVEIEEALRKMGECDCVVLAKMVEIERGSAA